MDKIIKLTINDKLNEISIKNVLYYELGLSSAIIKLLKRTKNGITLNGQLANVNQSVKNDDILILNISDNASEGIVPSDIDVDILYEDEDLIVLNKPYAMPTHPSLNHYADTLANGLMNYFNGKNFTFRAITRLDRDTSGVVLVAKNLYSAYILGDNMKNKQIYKEYIAIINGCPELMSGIINAPIKRKAESVILRTVASDGKDAVTEYEVEVKKDELSLIRLKPVTGRTHQLRVHMSYMGTPIYGDDLYGAKQINERTRLHCERVSFLHPTTKERLTVKAPIPDDIKELLY